MELGDLINQFVRDVCAGKTNETPTAYQSKMNHLKKFLGDEDITQEKMEAFKTYLLTRDKKQRGKSEVKGNLSLFTVRSVLATTRHFLRWAGERGKIPQGVMISNIKEPRPEPKYVDSLTVEKLLQAAGELDNDWERARNTAIIYVLRDTGGRVGSIVNIELGNMDLEKGYATAKDKGNQLSWLWFNAPTIDAIREWLHYRDQLNPIDYRLFLCTRGYGISRQGIYRMLGSLAKQARVQGRWNPHSFRHAFARDSLLAGADLGQVSDLMNHSSIVVTHKYYARWKKMELKRFHKRFSPGRNLPKVKKGSAKP